MAADIDVDFPHRGNSLRANRAGLGARAFHLKRVTSIVPQQSFGHLAAGGITST
jgi:hypothetical protein